MIGTKAPPMLNRDTMFAMRARWERIALSAIRQGLADELEQVIAAGGRDGIDRAAWVSILYGYWRPAVYEAYNTTTAVLIDATKGVKVGTLRNLDSDILSVVTSRADSIAEHNADGLAFGIDPDEWAALYDGWGEGWASGLARTDGVGAVGFGQSHAAQAFPLVKTWETSADDAVRATHMAAHGQTVPVTDFYVVGGAMLEFPGDPAGPASEVFNCRCWENYTQVG